MAKQKDKPTEKQKKPRPKLKRARVTIGIGLDGKPLIKWASGHTKKELAANVEILKKKYVGGVEVRNDAIFEGVPERMVRNI